MSLTRFLAVARKEVIQILRDSRSLIIVVIMPVILVLLFGYGVNLDLKGLPVYVYDRDGSQQSQDLLKRFQASEYFDVVRVVNDYSALARSLDDGHAKMGIVVPWDFSQRLRDGRPAEVQALVDGTDDNTANVLIGYAQAVVQGYSSDVQLDWLRSHGQIAQPASVSVETRTWYNENLESSAFIVPGVLALVMSVIGAFLTSLTISREWERGTMELLVSTPVSPMEVMLGKLTPYFLIGLLDAAFCLIFAVFWFGVPFRGAVLTLFIATSLFLVVVLGIGYLISVKIKSQVGAAQIGLLVTLLPTALLSGYTFPIDQMPPPVQAVTYLVFARYYVTALKALFLKGSGIFDLAPQLLAMAAYAAVVAFLAARAFRKNLD